MEDIKKPYTKRLSALENERSSFIAHWQEISQFISPYRGRFNNTSSGGTRKGQSDILCDIAGMALRTFSSGMMSGMTSPSYPWFRLNPPDFEMNEYAPVKDWLFEVEKRITEVFNSSNLYRALPTFYKELGLFGTACLNVSESFEDVISCHVPTVGQYCIANNSDYRVDTIYRKFNMTVNQLMSKHELEDWDVSDNVKTMAKNGNTESLVEVVHVIEPNLNREMEKIDGKNKPFKSVYFECGAEEKLLHEGGFDELPSFVARWETVAEDAYGLECPAMQALGDVKQLQSMTKTKGQGLAKNVAPPLVGPASLVGKRINAIPNGFTAVDEIGGADKLRALYEVNFRLAEMTADINEVKSLISKAFFEDLFMMLANTDRRNITAREVAERHEEKLLMLGPVLVRVHDELLSPLIDRTFSILLRGGLLPPPPKELLGSDLKVEFVSLLAQAQKSVGISGIDEMTQYIGGLSGLYPEAADKLDIYQVIDARANMLSVPPKMIRTDKDAQAITSQKMQAQQIAQQQAQMVASAGAARDLGAAADSNLPDMIRNMAQQR